MTRSVTAYEAVRSSAAESWTDRADAVGVPADLCEEPSARHRLVELLDDAVARLSAGGDFHVRRAAEEIAEDLGLRPSPH